MVLEQHTGLPTIRGVGLTRQSFSKWMEPSGEASPVQLTMSPGANSLSSLLTGPPSENATNVTGWDPENATRCEWPPLVSFGPETMVPLIVDGMWSSESWFVLCVAWPAHRSTSSLHCSHSWAWETAWEVAPLMP